MMLGLIELGLFVLGGINALPFSFVVTLLF